MTVSAPRRALAPRTPLFTRPLASRFALFVLILGIFGLSPVVSNGDSFLVAPTTASILHSSTLSIDRYVGKGTDGGIGYIQHPNHTGAGLPGRDLDNTLQPGDKAYNYFPWTNAVLALPVALVLKIPGQIGIPNYDFDRMVKTGNTGLFNLVSASVLSALTILVIFGIFETLLAGAVEPAKRRKLCFAACVAIALGTSFWSTLSRALFNQTGSTLFFAVALLLAAKLATAPSSRNRTAWLSFGLGGFAFAAYASRPTNAVGLVVLAGWLLAYKPRAIVFYVSGAVTAAVPWLLVNQTTYHSWQPPYFSANRVGLSPHMLEAIAANLISPNRGLLVFSPMVLLSGVGAYLAVKRSTALPQSLAITGCVIFLLHLLVVSGSGEQWWAGSSYGARFMADMIPLLALLAVPVLSALATASWSRQARRLVVGLVFASVALTAPGALSKPAQCWNLDPVNIDSAPSRVWSWTDMQALRPVKLLAHGGSLKAAVFQRCRNI